jgi:hypothetical protein
VTQRLALALLVALSFASPARAAPPARRKVAVLEFRGGVEQAAGLAQRLADRLKKTAALTVMGPLEARQTISRIDSEVAQCQGEAACLAKLGTKLEVDEVLLLGISKLGDVVLALQRIDVETRSVAGQLSEVLPPTDEVDDKKLLGWLKQLYPPDTFKRYGFIAVTANVDGATVTINGQEKGETPLDGKLKVLAPRAYRVDLTKDGFTPFAARIDVPPDATIEVRAEMSRDQGTVPWYKRWYLWAIVGGVVAASAIGVLVYEVQPDTSHVNGFVQH